MIGSKGITAFNDVKVSHFVIKPFIMDDLISQKNQLKSLIRQTNSIISHHDSKSQDSSIIIVGEKDQNQLKQSPKQSIQPPQQYKELTVISSDHESPIHANKISLSTLNLSHIEQASVAEVKPTVKETSLKFTLPKYNKNALQDFLNKPNQNDIEKSQRNNIPDAHIDFEKTPLSDHSSFIIETSRCIQNIEEIKEVNMQREQAKTQQDKYEDFDFERASHIISKLRNKLKPNSDVDTFQESLKPHCLPVVKNRIIQSLNSSKRKHSNSELSTAEASRNHIRHSSGFRLISKFTEKQTNYNKSLMDYIKLLREKKSIQNLENLPEDQLSAKIVSYAITQLVLSKKIDESKLSGILSNGRKFDSFLKKNDDDSLKVRTNLKRKSKAKSGDCTSLVKKLIRNRKSIKI